MLTKILPVALVLVGLGAGVGAGVALRPEPAPVAEADADQAPETHVEDAHASGVDAEFVRLPDQFVIPVISDDRVKSLVVMSLSLEVGPGLQESVAARMPKLRDGFLRVMLDHANVGGFDGAFTSNGSMDKLRRAFVAAAREQFPSGIRDVLVLDINRQDVI